MEQCKVAANPTISKGSCVIKLGDKIVYAGSIKGSPDIQAANHTMYLNPEDFESLKTYMRDVE